MKYKFSVGNDIGNSEIDMYVDDILVRQPNVYAETGQIPWSDDDIDVQKNIKNIYDNLAVSIISPAVPTGLYLIGKHALKTYGENVTSLYVKGNNAKSDQLVTYINTLSIIAARAVEKAYLEDNQKTEEITVIVDMAADLPVKQHTPSNCMNMLNKFMKSTHNVTVHLGATKKVDVKIKFEYVHVLPEGTPAVFALQMDKENAWRTTSFDGTGKTNIYEEFFKKYSIVDYSDGSYFDGKNILHVDSGDGTTDTPFTRGDAVDKDFCNGVNHGVGHAISDSINDLLALAPHAFNSVSRQQYSEILKSEYTARPHKFLSEAKSAFRPHSKNQVTQIINHTRDQVLRIGANEIDIVVVYGGGSILMREQLEPALEELTNNNRIQLFYVPAEYAVTLNAEGLCYFVKSPIFSALKKSFKLSDKEVATASE